VGATLVRSGVVYRRLEVGGGLQLDVHPYVVREAAHEEVGALLPRHPWGVAREGLEAVGVVLDRGEEGEAAEFRQAAPAHRWSETQEAELAKTLP
jgi:hypothetical protein